MKKVILIASLLFSIISCSNNDLKVNGTDQTVFNQTVDEVAKSLPLLQQSKFKEALEIIFQYRTNPSNDEEQRWGAVRNLIDDKTADEIFEMAEAIANQNNFLWNRNQVPLVNGIPLPGSNGDENSVAADLDSSSDIQRFDFRISNELEGFRIDPFFFDVEGKEIHTSTPVKATIEIFSGGNIIQTKRVTFDPNSVDALYRNNGFLVKFNSLDKSKLKSNIVDVLIRIPHPDRYLTQRKSVELPASFIGEPVVEINDSIVKEINKDVTMITSLSNRFIQNLSKKNYSAGFALTRSNDWSTYQKFSSDSFVTGLADSKVKDTKVLDGDEKVTLVETTISLADNTLKKYILTLENINNKWFIIDVK